MLPVSHDGCVASTLHHIQAERVASIMKSPMSLRLDDGLTFSEVCGGEASSKS